MQSTSSQINVARKTWSFVCNSLCIVTVLVAQRMHAEDHKIDSATELSVAHAVQPPIVRTAERYDDSNAADSSDTRNGEAKIASEMDRALTAGISTFVLPKLTLAQAHQAHRIVLPVAVFVFMVTFGTWLLISVQNKSMKRIKS